MERYALRSDVLRKLGSMIYNSGPYAYFTKKVDKFRDDKLLEQIKKSSVPQHVAVIMDGNRRFAKDAGLDPKAGHIFGKNKLEQVLEWCFELGIKNLTVYAFSTENFNRDHGEVQTLMQLCKDEISRASKD